MNTIKDDRSVKSNSSSKVDLKDLYLNQFIKYSTEIQFLKWYLEKFIGTPLTRTSSIQIWKSNWHLNKHLTVNTTYLALIDYQQWKPKSKHCFSRGYPKYPIGPYKHETTVPQILILNGKETETIKWNCTHHY